METSRIDPLLNTKYVIPHLPPRYMPRTELFKELEGRSQNNLTFLIAPAGYGKTTALIHWAKETLWPVAWLSLDSEDNDPLRFFSYLFKGLGRVNPKWVKELDALLASYHVVFIQSFIRSIIGIVAQHSTRFALILDDYHLIRSNDIHTAIGYLLENQPDNIHIMISSRSEPKLPLAKLRVKDVVHEIRIEELRFSLEEINAYFLSAEIPPLSQSDLEMVEAKTEGWAAGIQLIAQLLHNGDTAESLKRISSGGSRHIMDYLVQEVLELQSKDTQEFLLRTSILNRFNASICEATTGIQDSQHILLQLETNGVFILPLDHERCWYRYHPLFQEILQRMIREKSTGEEPLLHQRASEWLAREGFHQEAIYHALQAKNFSHAADIAGIVGQEMMNQGRFHTLYSWLRCIPYELIISRPNLCSGRAWAQAMVGDVSDVDHWISCGLKEPDQPDSLCKDDRTALMCNSFNIRSMAAQVRGEYEEALRFAQEAYASLPENNPLLSAVTHAKIGDAYFFLGMLEPSKREYQKAANDAKELSQLFVYMKASYYLCRIHFLQGETRIAAITIDEANTHIGDRIDYPPKAGYYLIHGDLLYNRNALVNAEEYYLEGLRLARISGDYYYILGALEGLGKICLARQEFEKAEEYFRDIERLASWASSKPDIELAKALRMSIALIRNDSDEIRFWVESIPSGSNHTSGVCTTLCRYHLLRYQILNTEDDRYSDLKPTLNVLNQEIRLAEDQENRYHLMQLRLMSAVAHSRGADKKQQETDLIHALSIGHHSSYFRCILDEDLLLQAKLMPLIQNTMKDLEKVKLVDLNFLERIINSSRSQTYDLSMPLSDRELLVSLTDREIEILRLYSTGHSSREIAARLVISFHTVRTHLRNIYQKLDIHNRTQAIVKARDLHLI
jgi:LuxR family maltose regulon positive regulatory protein